MGPKNISKQPTGSSKTSNEGELSVFPKNFWWGAATSAHQVEGSNHNNWTVWELENAKSLAAQASHKLIHLPVWGDIDDQATDPNNYVSGVAVDHYNRYEEDFDIAKRLNFNIFRFSIEWSRVEPEEGAWDAAEIEHYRKYIAALRERGLEPFPTFFHWSLPVWFVKKGGFEKAGNVKYFVRYVEKVLTELGAGLNMLTTINEPDTVAGHGYILLVHPPQTHSYWKAFWVYRNMLLGHRRVYKMVKKRWPRITVGFTKSYAYVHPGDENWLSRLAVRFDYAIRDDLVLGYVGGRNDFIGVNFYFRDSRVGARLEVDGGYRVNDLGWGMYPECLDEVLLRISRRHPNTPIIITESGTADMHDKYRKWWIAASIRSIKIAMKHGAKVKPKCIKSRVLPAASHGGCFAYDLLYILAEVWYTFNRYENFYSGR